MYIMCLIIFEEKTEIQDQYPLSLNRDQDRLQKYWAIEIWKQTLFYKHSNFLLKKVCSFGDLTSEKKFC